MPQTEYGGKYVRHTRHIITTTMVVYPLVGCSSLGGKSERLLDIESWEMHCDTALLVFKSKRRLKDKLTIIFWAIRHISAVVLRDVGRG